LRCWLSFSCLAVRDNKKTGEGYCEKERKGVIMGVIVQFIIIQTIVFGIVIFILKKMMVGDTESAVNRLNESYAEINKKKEELATKIQEIEQEYEKRKAEAEKVADKIREATEEEIRKKSDAIIKKAHEEAERLVADAMTARDRMREELKKEEEMKMVDYCENLLTDVLPDILTGEINALLIKNFLNELEQLSMDKIPPAIQEIELVVSRQMDDAIRVSVEEITTRKMQRPITCKVVVDKKILGGVIVRFGSLVLDGSIVAKLRESSTLKKQTIEERR